MMALAMHERSSLVIKPASSRRICVRQPLVTQQPFSLPARRPFLCGLLPV